MGRPKPDARSVVEPEPSPLRLLFRHFKALLPPDTLHSLVVHSPALPVQKYGDSAVSVAPILAGQPCDPLHQSWLVVRDTAGPTLRVPGLPYHPACPAFADAVAAEYATNVLDRFPPLRRA